MKTKQTTLAKEFLKGTVHGFFFGSGVMFWASIALGLVADKFDK